MTPIGENYGYGSFLSTYHDKGKPMTLNHGDIDVELTSTSTGGHVKVVDKGTNVIVIDTELINGETAEYITSTGNHVVYAGDVDRDAVEGAIAGVENHNLPILNK